MRRRGHALKFCGREREAAYNELAWRPRLVRLVRQAKDRRLLLAGPAVRLDRYEDDLKAGSAGHGPVRLLASFTGRKTYIVY